jgi:hypothetical protein
MVYPMLYSIGSERKVLEMIPASFAIQGEENAQTSLCDRGMRTCHINVVTTGASVPRLGEATRYQELLHRGVGKLNDPRIAYFDDGEQTRAQ